MPSDPGRLEQALAILGRDETVRREFIQLLKRAERTLSQEMAGRDSRGEPRSLRDEITGPIVDALHSDSTTEIEKSLHSGVSLRFLYRSKIARDLVLSEDGPSDHFFEPQTTKLLLHLSNGAHQVLVGGAYAGDHVIPMAKAMAPSGTCHAFEPNPDQFAMLLRNARENRVENLVPNKIGLWNQEHVTLALFGEDACAYVKPIDDRQPRPSGTSFSSTTIDAYARARGLSHIDLIMLDIEGSEFRALQGAERFLSMPKESAPNVVFEIHRSYVDWSHGLANTDIVQFLVERGYTVFAVRDFQSNQPMPGCPVEIIPPDETYLEGPPHGFNMLAVKDPALIRAEIFRICHGVSPKLLLHKSPKLHHPTYWIQRE